MMVQVWKNNKLCLISILEIAQSRQISSTASDIQIDLFDGQESMDLATFLIKISCQNNSIANFLYWLVFLFSMINSILNLNLKVFEGGSASK